MNEEPKRKRRAKMSLTSKPGDVVKVGDVVIRFRAGRRVTIECPADQRVTMDDPEDSPTPTE